MNAIQPARGTALTAALVLGSARQTGWSRKVGRALSELCPSALVLEEIEIADLPLYHEDLEAAEPLPWARFRAQIRAADAVLFVTPEYNRSIPAALKNAIDIGSSPEDESVWSGKPGAIASFSPGALGGFGANHHLRQTLVFLDVPVLQQPEVYLSRVDAAFDADGRLLDGPVTALLTQFMLAFCEWIARTRRLQK